MNTRILRHPTAIAGLERLERLPVADARGRLERVFCAGELAPLLGAARIEQINRTSTRRAGTVRGLHFQRPPDAERKFVTCLRGRIFDVVVDLRAGSPTFLTWHAVVLDAAEPFGLSVPPGCAHGFQALCDDVDLLYLHTEPWRAHSEAGIHPLEPQLGIPWPLPVRDLSPRDQTHPALDGCFAGVSL